MKQMVLGLAQYLQLGAESLHILRIKHSIYNQPYLIKQN